MQKLTARAATPENVGALLSDLAASDSGIGFIYRCLDATVEAWELRDALVVLEDTPVGRQVFRAGRRSPEGPWSIWHTAHARPGLYTDPTVIDAVDEIAAVADLCRVALRLDLARYDSLHDALTGLYNRRCFDDLLASAVGRSRRYGWSFALVLLDLDHFKKVNDRLGHDAGDAVLHSLGAEMRRTLRRGDIAARIGGDEFALLLPATEPDFIPQLLERLEAGMKTGTEGAQVGVSVGVASCPDDADDVATLRRIADERLYKAKQK